MTQKSQLSSMAWLGSWPRHPRAESPLPSRRSMKAGAARSDSRSISSETTSASWVAPRTTKRALRPSRKSAPRDSLAGKGSGLMSDEKRPSEEAQRLAERAAQRLAERAAQALVENDKTAQSLGIRLEEVRPGYARMTMQVRA